MSLHNPTLFLIRVIALTLPALCTFGIMAGILLAAAFHTELWLLLSAGSICVLMANRNLL